MKSSKVVYYLCYYSHLCFYYSFWGYFLILIILRFFGVELNTYLGYIFFLLFGLWAGSATALFATRYMKDAFQKEQDRNKEDK